MCCAQVWRVVVVGGLRCVCGFCQVSSCCVQVWMVCVAVSSLVSVLSGMGVVGVVFRGVVVGLWLVCGVVMVL